MRKILKSVLAAVGAVALFAGVSAVRADSLTLEVGDIIKGSRTEMTVTGATPRNRVYFCYSITGTGPTYVPFFHTQLDLSMPITVFVSRRADTSGNLTITPYVARNNNYAPPDGTTMWFQAVEVREFDTIVSDVEERVVGG